LAVIGGRAHINGITFVTNTHIVRGKLTIQVLLILVVALTIGYGIIYRISGTNWFKLAFLIGSFIQKYIVTSEPTEEQIQLAYATISRAIECDRKI